MESAAGMQFDSAAFVLISELGYVYQSSEMISALMNVCLHVSVGF